ncbi:hypothetical protein D3C81_1332360 [compost metagenome]
MNPLFVGSQQNVLMCLGQFLLPAFCAVGSDQGAENQLAVGQSADRRVHQPVAGMPLGLIVVDVGACTVQHHRDIDQHFLLCPVSSPFKSIEQAECKLIDMI